MKGRAFTKYMFERVANGAAIREWKQFYSNVNMEEINDFFPEEISFSSALISMTETALKKGFYRVFIFPPVSVQEKSIHKLRIELGKPMKGLRRQKQFRKAWLSPNTIGLHLRNRKRGFQTTLNRPAGPYLLFLSDDLEVSKETIELRSAAKIRKWFKEKGETGLTLFEYLVFQRSFTENHIKDECLHPDVSYVTWLLDSCLEDDSLVLVAGSNKGKKFKIKVWAWPETYNEHNCQGARSSIVVPL